MHEVGPGVVSLVWARLESRDTLSECLARDEARPAAVPDRGEMGVAACSPWSAKWPGPSLPHLGPGP